MVPFKRLSNKLKLVKLKSNFDYPDCFYNRAILFIIFFLWKKKSMDGTIKNIILMKKKKSKIEVWIN